MKTFRTLKKGDKILMEHASFREECYEKVNETIYLSKLRTKDIEVEVVSKPEIRQDLTEEEMKNMTLVVYVTTFGTLYIPYEYQNTHICPNVKNGATAKII